MRKVYVVTYDISDDRRRDRVFRILRGFGDHLQFSVFRCELSETELVRLRGRLLEAIHSHEDQVLVADLGPGRGRGRRAITALGRHYTHPERHALVF
ncbi:MAG: CRISPR-associated endonuclease Cas2 [Planctomycetes bacterium]|nr:CRISPR-associated endonuclease Cas2 [Planctomycetota bacterium]